MKANLLISFCYTLAYVVLANILFYTNPLSYYAGEGLSTALMLPAALAFEVAYTSSDDAALVMTLIIFLVIWALIFLLILLARKTYTTLRKKNS